MCPVCQKAYKSKQTLKVHVDGKHRGITHDCQHCAKKFKSPSALYQHVKKCFAARSTLGQHVRKMHGAATKKDAESMEDTTEQGKPH